MTLRLTSARSLAVVTAALALAVPTLASATVSKQPSAASKGMEVLSFDRLPDLEKLPSTPAPVAEKLLVEVALQNPTVAAEKAFYARLYDPKDGEFHHFLTPAEVGKRFAVPAIQRRAAEDQLRTQGLTITDESTEGDFIAAEGSVAQIQKTFNLHLRYFFAQGRRFIANVEGPTVPKLAHVLTVIGLNTWQRYNLPTRKVAKPAIAGQHQCLPAVGCIAGLSPRELWSVYNEPASYLGQGQSMAVIGEGSPKGTIKGLAAFQAANKLPHTALKVVCVQHHDCGADTAGDGEWQIDTQASLGMAPLAQETLYFSQGLEDPKIDLAFLTWINDPKGASQADASEGVCEQNPLNDVFRGPLEPINGDDDYSLPISIAVGDDQEPVIEQALRHASLEGRTLFSSTGDTGFTCATVLFPVISGGNGVLYNGYVDVLYPASSAYAVAVGGTVLYTDGKVPARRTLEYAWNFGGGGTSLFQPSQKFQQAQSHVLGRCVSSPDSFAKGNLLPCRGVPDVAALSGDIASNGYTVYQGANSTFSGGGTSLSSPLWLGMWARVQSQARVLGAKHGLGFADETIYAIGNSALAKKDFNDITVGANLYPALPGWDYTTGFGSPHLTELATDAVLHSRMR